MPPTLEQQARHGNLARPMTPFEWRYLCLQNFLPVLYPTVRRRLLKIAAGIKGRPSILDVGGRKSHYTIGVPADVTVSDLPRETDVQQQLHLGINSEIVSQLRARRSNITAVELDDMTRSSFGNEQFDCIVAIEVLEHVEKDAAFVREVSRVLKPGGVFLMTTPNGEFVQNTNPDHKRHYTKDHLMGLLSSSFDLVRVDYAVKSGLFYNWALHSWSVKRPIRTALAMFAAVVNSLDSAGKGVCQQSWGTQELVAEARKRPA
jgi:SAM-dependent methyltransferase